jgi:hypothetical protein
LILLASLRPVCTLFCNIGLQCMVGHFVILKYISTSKKNKTEYRVEDGAILPA